MNSHGLLDEWVANISSKYLRLLKVRTFVSDDIMIQYQYSTSKSLTLSIYFEDWDIVIFFLKTTIPRTGLGYSDYT